MRRHAESGTAKTPQILTDTSFTRFSSQKKKADSGALLPIVTPPASLLREELPMALSLGAVFAFSLFVSSSYILRTPELRPSVSSSVAVTHRHRGRQLCPRESTALSRRPTFPKPRAAHCT